MVEQLWEDTINTSHCNTRLDLIIYSVLLFLWTYPQRRTCHTLSHSSITSAHIDCVPPLSDRGLSCNAMHHVVDLGLGYVALALSK
jgi:hypothetical protein